MNFYNEELQMLARISHIKQGPDCPDIEPVALSNVPQLLHVPHVSLNSIKPEVEEGVSERPDVVFKTLFTKQDLSNISEKWKTTLKEQKENEETGRSSGESPLHGLQKHKKDFKPPILSNKVGIYDEDDTLTEKLNLARKLREELVLDEKSDQSQCIEKALSFLSKYRKPNQTTVYYPPSRIDEMTSIRYERDFTDKDGFEYQELIIIPKLNDEEQNWKRSKKLGKIKRAFLPTEPPKSDDENSKDEDSIDDDNLVVNFNDYLSEEGTDEDEYLPIPQIQKSKKSYKKDPVHTVDSTPVNPINREEIFDLFTLTDLDAAGFDIGEKQRNTSFANLEKYNPFFKAEIMDGVREFKPDTLNIMEDLTKFIGIPPPVGHLIKCRIVRDKHPLHPTYYLYLERNDDGHKILILAARKRSKCKTSNYVITTDSNDIRRESEKFVGKLRANMFGTQFVLYGPGRSIKDHEPKSFLRIPLMKKKDMDLSLPYREELAVIVYELNVLGANGPRKLELTIPAMINEIEHVEMRPENLYQTTVEKEKFHDLTGLVKLRNKKPVWNDETQSFVLNFHGRVTQASVKNFQVIHELKEDYVILQFGRIGEDSFTLDFRYPLSPLQAFGIALASFDNKIACD